MLILNIWTILKFFFKLKLAVGLTTGVPITILWRFNFALGLNLALGFGKPNGFGARFARC